MSLTILLALAAALPHVPASEVQLVQEGDAYVMRNLIDNAPLYTLDTDSPGQSNCNDSCAAEWRPLWAPPHAEPAGKWTVMKRGDGSSQWAYAGMPVYSFAQDPEPVTLGDGAVGTWRRLPAVPVK